MAENESLYTPPFVTPIAELDMRHTQTTYAFLTCFARQATLRIVRRLVVGIITKLPTNHQTVQPQNCLTFLHQQRPVI